MNNKIFAKRPERIQKNASFFAVLFPSAVISPRGPPFVDNLYDMGTFELDFDLTIGKMLMGLFV